MPEANNVTLVEMTTEVVAAYVAKNAVQASDMPGLIAAVHEALAGLGQASTPEAEAEPLKPAVPIKKSITDGYLVCLDDGKHFSSLKRHLAVLGMTPAQYRAKWGLPADYPMVAPAYAKQRSELAKSIGLGSLRKKA